MAFTVSLSSAATQRVLVDYATRNATATAGLDYTAKSGTLTFAAGETAKTVPVPVPVLADAHNEGSETFSLASPPPRGPRLPEGTATVTITNDGHVPKDWIRCFGRTVADQVLDAVESRMQAPPTPGREGGDCWRTLPGP